MVDVLYPDHRIDLRNLPAHSSTPLPAAAPGAPGKSLRELEREFLERVLAEYKGNKSAAAKSLKMHRRTLQRKLARGS